MAKTKTPKPTPQTMLPPMAQPTVQMKDDFKDGRPVLGGPGGFTAPSLDVKYTVERIVPPDGLLGAHYGRFSVEELGKEYGGGTYKILKYGPGQPIPVEYIQKVGLSYGQPKVPKVPNLASVPEGVVPTKMVERSILNRLMECRQVLDSATSKMKLKKIDPSVIKGETDFLLSTIKDVGSLLSHLSRNGRG